MQHFRANHFAAFHFASNQFRGVAVTPQPDTHDGFGYWEKYWKKLHEKKKPTIEEIIEAVQENPVEALKAVPQAKKQFQGIDYSKVKQNAEMALFIAQELMIVLEMRRILDEDEETAIEMLLLM
jgi:Txe/YoeB family toxin of Txe-Axe toxin-antitoxin module